MWKLRYCSSCQYTHCVGCRLLGLHDTLLCVYNLSRDVVIQPHRDLFWVNTLLRGALNQFYYAVILSMSTTSTSVLNNFVASKYSAQGRTMLIHEIITLIWFAAWRRYWLKIKGKKRQAPHWSRTSHWWVFCWQWLYDASFSFHLVTVVRQWVSEWANESNFGN